MVNKLFLSMVLLALLTSVCFSQSNPNDIVLGKTIIIQSKYLNEDRQIFIYTPPGYENSQQKYPVFYLLDGGGHFLHASGVVQFLSAQGRIPQMIVVAIPNTVRNRDFTPTIDKYTPGSGGAENFISFMNDELFPYVNDNYRTQPFKILFGHSLTAMFTFHLFATQHDLFNAYIAASPYLMYDNNLIVQSMESFMKSKPITNNFFYFTVGNEPDYFPGINKVISYLNEFASPELIWKYVKMESEDHGSIPHKTIYDGLEFIYSNWRLQDEELATGVSGIKEHFKKLSEKFGYEIIAPEFLINRLGYQYLNKGIINEAVAIFKLNVANYPNSANVYDSLGDAYVAAGNLEHAKHSYSLAVEKGEATSDPNLQTYKNNLTNVINKMAE